MNIKKNLLATEFITEFLITSSCICILMGVLGVLLLPNQQFGYEAFFSPLIFGFLTNIPSLLLRSIKKMDQFQIFYHILNLVMIEGIIFGLNPMIQSSLTARGILLLMLGIAVVYALVHLVLRLIDMRIAYEFNKQLVLWQEKESLTQESTLHPF